VKGYIELTNRLQIGGTLAKLVYFSRESGSAGGGGRLNFLSFETDRIDLCIDFIQELKQKQSKLNGSTPAQLCVMATGGGAYKFYDRMKDVLHVNVIREDEMECLIIGTLKLLMADRGPLAAAHTLTLGDRP